MKRYLIPAALAAAVLALAGLALAFALTSRPATDAAGRTAPPARPAAPSPPAATSPAAGPVPTARAVPPPAVTSEPAEEPAEPAASDVDPGAVEAATAFAAAWLNSTDPEWPRKLADRSTPELAQAWAGADPGTVPVGRVGGPIVGDPAGDGLVDVKIPVVDSKGGPVGLLTVEIAATTRGWLVSDVDWVRAS